jgi:hypothetical protein
MKSCLIVLLVLFLASCAGEIPKSSPMYLPAIDGPRIVPTALLETATEVRIFVFDFGECNDFNIFQKESELNLVAEGVRLSDQQLRRLKSLIPNRHYQGPGSMCFNPHHAIAWFDATGKVFASAEICFECDAVQLQIGNEHFAYSMELTLFREFIESLGAPISLARTCDRQQSVQAPWQTPVKQICALNSIRLEGLASLPKNWLTPNNNDHQQSCVRNTREVIF